MSGQENVYIRNLREQRSASSRERRAYSSTKKATRVASRSMSKDPNATTQSVGQKAKRKYKQMQTKKANDRLARLEKMYQELTQIENK